MVLVDGGEMKPAKVPYDPEWAVSLFRSKLDPADPETAIILENLGKCREVVGFCDCGCGAPYFIDPDGADWSPTSNPCCMQGSVAVILDVMSDLRIGAIETLDLEALSRQQGGPGTASPAVRPSYRPPGEPDDLPGGRS